jgi:hypothetical protein
MPTMNRIHVALAYLQSSWRTIALCALVLYVLLHYRNQGRFVPAQNSTFFWPVAFDTRTGQYCNPYEPGLMDGMHIANCSDLAKSWH